jgi:hypothetical protein
LAKAHRRPAPAGTDGAGPRQQDILVGAARIRKAISLDQRHPVRQRASGADVRVRSRDRPDAGWIRYPTALSSRIPGTAGACPPSITSRRSTTT